MSRRAGGRAGGAGQAATSGAGGRAGGAGGTWAPAVFSRPRPTARLPAYAAIGIGSMVGAMALGRPELVIVAAPFLALVVIALAIGPTPALEVSVSLSSARLVEGEEVDLTVGLAKGRGLHHIDIRPALGTGLAPVGHDQPDGFALLLSPGRRNLTLRLRCEHWGAYDLGRVHLRSWDLLHLVQARGESYDPIPVRVLPRLDTLRTMIAPSATRAVAGNQLSRRSGEGLEFANIRPYQTGDRARSVNWRVSARRGDLWVNEQYLEQATDVVLFLDLFESVSDSAGPGTLDRSVRAAARLAAAYLARRDRVGLISFGGYLEWVRPGMGTTTLYRIVDALLASVVMPTTAWKDIQSLPVRGLPPRALVLGITPLLDERAIQVLFDLRRRGWDVAVIDVSPLGYSSGQPEGGRAPSRGRLTRRGRQEPLPATRVTALARRMWSLQRRQLHEAYRSAGIAVVEWDRSTAADVAIRQLEGTRRIQRRGVV